MATTTTVSNGVSTTSMFLTPQAVDDTYLISEDVVGITYFDVMLNDLGGNAKTLYSIVAGSESELDSTDITDLITKDSVNVYESSALGAQVAIVNGKIAYDTFSIASLINALGAGETLTDTITYAIRLGNGTLSLATLTVTINGTNDAPVIAVVGTDTAGDTLNETNSGLTADGTLTVTDVDTSDEVSSSVTGVVLSGDFGSLSESDVLSMLSVAPLSGLAADTGDANNLAWSFDSGLQAFDFLANTESLTLTYTITSADGNGGSDTQDVTIVINGTADGVTIPPVFTGTGDPNDKDSEATGAAGGIIINDLTSGPNTLRGGSGNDTIHGNNGNDLIYGGAGDDNIFGDANNDTIYGGSGNDTISGGINVDNIYGGSGNDSIVGDDNNDQIYGGYGADTLTGGANVDTFHFLSLLDTGDTVTDFTGAGIAGGDVIDFSELGLSGGFSNTTATADSAWYSTDGTDATIYVDTDGNISSAELVITLKNVTSLIASDFDFIL